MSTVHSLPSGASVELLDVADLRAKHKRAIQRSIAATDPEHPVKNLVDANDHIIRTVTVSHNIPYGVPGEDWLDSLTLADLDEINKLMVPLAEALFPDAPDPVAPGQPDDPNTPSTPVSE